MNKTYNTCGIVLNQKDWRENDRLFSVYTKDFGKLQLSGIGMKKIKSKLAGHLASFGVVDLLIAKSKVCDKIAGAHLAVPFDFDLSTDFLYLSVIYEILEKSISQQQPDQQIWLLLINSMKRLKLAKNIDEKKFVTIFFLYNLLRLLGYLPQLNYCLKCQKSNKSFVFSLSENGLLCSDCQSSVDKDIILISQKLIDFLTILISENKLPQIVIKKSVLTEAINFIKNWIPYVLEKKINSLLVLN